MRDSFLPFYPPQVGQEAIDEGGRGGRRVRGGRGIGGGAMKRKEQEEADAKDGSACGTPRRGVRS